MLDSDWVRSRFPALDGPHGDWALFDNAGGSAPLGTVIEEIARYMREVPVQTGASYAPSVDAVERQAAAHGRVATLLGVDDPETLIMGGSASELLSRLARSLCASSSPGDEIVLTDADHEANISPWLRAAEAHGLEVRWWRTDPTSRRLESAALEPLLGDHTRVVAVTHVSNVLGRIEPVAEIAERVHGAGAQLVVDGVAHVPHRSVELANLGADYYVFSWYKVFGPHHGLLWGRRDRLLALPGVNHTYIPDSQLPYKFQPGAAPYELTVGCARIVDYLEALAREHGSTAGDARGRVEDAYRLIAGHETALMEPLLAFLERRDDVDVIGDRDSGEHVSLVSFTVDGRSSAEITRAVEAARCGIRFGHFHAKRLVEGPLGLDPGDGVVRVSMAHYNTLDEVQRLVGALAEALG